MHCIGVLFDSSVPNSAFLNGLASGSGSRTASASTYDVTTRGTVESLVRHVEERAEGGRSKARVSFVSCAEELWTRSWAGRAMESVAPGFLRRYLVAKRAAVGRLVGSESVVETIVRPSIIYTPGDLGSAVTVAAFRAASRVPGVGEAVKEPRTVEDVAREAVEGAVGWDVTK